MLILLEDRAGASIIAAPGGRDAVCDRIDNDCPIDGIIDSAAFSDNGRTIWIVDAHRDGTRFVVRAEEKLTAFLN